MPDKKRAVHPETDGKKGVNIEKNSSTSSTLKSKKEKGPSKEKDKEAVKEKEKDDDEEDEKGDEEEVKPPVKSQEVVQQPKEKGVQMQYIPYSPQFVGPQQQQQQRYQMGGQMGGQPGMPMMMNSHMAVPVPMQALIPVYAPIKGVLPGLEALSVSGGCFIKQELDIMEMFSGLEMNNRYAVLNSLGQRIYLAVDVFSGVGAVVLNIERKQSYALCWWGGRVAGSHVTVTHASTGEELGTVRQDCSMCNPSYEVLDAKRTLLLKISGPSCGSCCPLVMCCDVKFGVTDPEGNEVGQILKTFQMLEMISDVTCFGVNYSQKLPINLKALILASVICIDFSYFEGSQGMRGSGGGYGQRRGGGGKCSLNLSGCRCVWFWFYMSLLIGVYIYYYFYSDRYRSRYD